MPLLASYRAGTISSLPQLEALWHLAGSFPPPSSMPLRMQMTASPHGLDLVRDVDGTNKPANYG